MLAQAKRHQEALELERKLFLKARALAMAQRLMLYARDELEMAVRAESEV